MLNYQKKVKKNEHFQNMGPSSLNIHFYWLGVLCFLTYFYIHFNFYIRSGHHSYAKNLIFANTIQTFNDTPTKLRLEEKKHKILTQPK